MDLMHPNIIELLAEQALRERRDAAQAYAFVDRKVEKPGSIRQTLASYLVRLGLRLDPAAGGGLGAPTQREARRCA